MTESLVSLNIPMPAHPQQSASAAMGAALALVVQTDDAYAGAGAILLDIKARRKLLDDERKKLVQPIDEARARVQALFRQPLADLDECERIVKSKLVTYSNAQEEARRAEQAKADEAARKEQEKLAERSRKAFEAGKTEKADELAERAATVVAPIVQREAPKVAGIAPRVVWKYEVIDESQVPLEYRPIDHSKLGGVVRALKASTRIPGVRVYSVNDVSASTRGAK